MKQGFSLQIDVMKCWKAGKSDWIFSIATVKYLEKEDEENSEDSVDKCKTKAHPALDTNWERNTYNLDDIK